MENSEEKELTVREWIEAYKAGKFKTVNDMGAAGWWDWFCTEKGLVSRLKALAPVVNGITNEFILDNFRIWFKNNCPSRGPLYDDIRFEPLDESKREECYFIVVKDDKREDFKWVVYTAEDIFEKNASKPSFGASTTKEVIAFINNMKF